MMSCRSSLSLTQIIALVSDQNFLIDFPSKLCLYLLKHNLILSLFVNRTEGSFKLFIKSRHARKKIEAVTPNLRVDVFFMELLTSRMELKRNC